MEVAQEAAVMIAENEHQLDAAGQTEERIFNKLTFCGAGARCMYEVAQQDEAAGLERVDDGVETGRSDGVGGRPELAAAPESPGVPEMEVGQERSA